MRRRVGTESPLPTGLPGRRSGGVQVVSWLPIPERDPVEHRPPPLGLLEMGRDPELPLACVHAAAGLRPPDPRNDAIGGRVDLCHQLGAGTEPDEPRSDRDITAEDASASTGIVATTLSDVGSTWDTDPSLWFMTHTPPSPTSKNRGPEPTSISDTTAPVSGSTRTTRSSAK